VDDRTINVAPEYPPMGFFSGSYGANNIVRITTPPPTPRHHYPSVLLVIRGQRDLRGKRRAKRRSKAARTPESLKQERDECTARRF